MLVIVCSGRRVFDQVTKSTHCATLKRVARYRETYTMTTHLTAPTFKLHNGLMIYAPSTYDRQQLLRVTRGSNRCASLSGLPAIANVRHPLRPRSSEYALHHLLRFIDASLQPGAGQALTCQNSTVTMPPPLASQRVQVVSPNVQNCHIGKTDGTTCRLLLTAI